MFKNRKLSLTTCPGRCRWLKVGCATYKRLHMTSFEPILCTPVAHSKLAGGESTEGAAPASMPETSKEGTALTERKGCMAAGYVHAHACREGGGAGAGPVRPHQQQHGGCMQRASSVPHQRIQHMWADDAAVPRVSGLASYSCISKPWPWHRRKERKALALLQSLLCPKGTRIQLQAFKTCFGIAKKLAHPRSCAPNSWMPKCLSTTQNVGALQLRARRSWTSKCLGIATKVGLSQKLCTQQLDVKMPQDHPKRWCSPTAHRQQPDPKCLGTPQKLAPPNNWIPKRVSITQNVGALQLHALSSKTAAVPYSTLCHHHGRTGARP